jgi:hypothetical protein
MMKVPFRGHRMNFGAAEVLRKGRREFAEEYSYVLSINPAIFS